VLYQQEQQQQPQPQPQKIQDPYVPPAAEGAPPLLPTTEKCHTVGVPVGRPSSSETGLGTISTKPPTRKSNPNLGSDDNNNNNNNPNNIKEPWERWYNISSFILFIVFALIGDCLCFGG
jgi:hypothetical protein